MKKYMIAAGVLFCTSSFAMALPCNPAVQNWAQGSRTTCPFDSGGQSPDPRAPAPVVVVKEKCHDGYGYGTSEGRKGKKGKKDKKEEPDA